MAKFICEVEGLADAFAPPRALYSGTCSQYARDLLHRRGFFRHEAAGQPVHLSEQPLIAMSVARRRACFYKDAPLALVVDAERMEGDVRFDGKYRVDELKMGSFLPYEFSLDENGQFTEEDVAGLLRMKDWLLQSSDEQILRRTADFLGEAPAEP